MFCVRVENQQEQRTQLALNSSVVVVLFDVSQREQTLFWESFFFFKALFFQTEIFVPSIFLFFALYSNLGWDHYCAARLWSVKNKGHYYSGGWGRVHLTFSLGPSSDYP